MSTTESRDRVLAKAITELEKLGGLLHREEEIARGDGYVIPRDVTLKQAALEMGRLAKADEEEAVWQRTFPYRPNDGLVALSRAIKKAFGALTHKGTMGFWGPNPPAFVEVEVGYGEKVQVPYGRFEVPGMEGVEFEPQQSYDEELGMIFQIVAEGRKKFRHRVEGLFKLVEQQLAEDSIYRGRALDARFRFLDLSKVDPAMVIYAEDVERSIETNILGPIRYRDEMRAAGVDLKSAVLLAGTYGTGKTLCAYLTAQECVRNGFTFLQVRPNQDDLKEAMQTARVYSPAVVFFEDVDTIGSSDEAQDHISGLLELFDGVRAKGADVMAILTTNHAEKIHKGMVRPGRIDAVIEVGPPDGPGIIRMCKRLVQADLLSPTITDDEWQAIAKAAEGYLPAFVHEGCKRAVKFAITRGKGQVGEPITGADLLAAMIDLRPQYDLMLGARDVQDRDSLTVAFEDLVRNTSQRASVRVIKPSALSGDGIELLERIQDGR